jgi:ubiquinone/menaquinone biosynthesis C-methylase UbiE
MNAMSGISAEIRVEFVKKFDFSRYSTITDVGGGTGLLSIAIADKIPHIKTCITTDLFQVKPLADKNTDAASSNVQETVQFVSSNFFEEDVPSSDLLIMSIILHEFPLSKKLLLLEKAYKALPESGSLVIVDSMIDDERRERTYGLCMSVNMLIELGVDGGFDYTESDVCCWCKQVGFARVEVQSLSKMHSMCIAHKN